ncbi:MAG: hypothetical protein O2779_05515 [Nanoarchaeota archaeon]|nr:hypothetical protein [Nanoarchaeota archaeon]
MKYLLLAILLISTVSAMSPAPEVDCCYELLSYPQSSIAKECTTIENVKKSELSPR